MILVDALAQQPLFVGKPSDAKGNKIFSIPCASPSIPVARIAPNVAVAGHLPRLAIKVHVQPQAVESATCHAYYNHRPVSLCRGLA